MSHGANPKISAASARSHTRESKPSSSLGILWKLLLVLLAGFCAWAYQACTPPPPKICGSPDGPVISSSRIKLRDGRYLAYEESGVPKEIAKSKIIFVHGFSNSKYFHPFQAAFVSPALVEELGVYIVALDRPGYGESDPHPQRTVKSLAFDIEELADQLNLGPKFYIAGYSMGGMVTWSCLKYIPHRLAGAALIAPGINFWWPHLPSNLSNEAFSQQLKQDQWAYRVAHYAPWLSYWWNTQKWFSRFAIIESNFAILPPSDLAVVSKLVTVFDPTKIQTVLSHPRQQGEYESLHVDLNVGFGKWDFGPMDIENPFPNKEGSVHIWQGDEDLVVNVALQRYIAQKLEWVQYHEVAGIGHLLAFSDGVSNAILKSLVSAKEA